MWITAQDSTTVAVYHLVLTTTAVRAIQGGLDLGLMLYCASTNESVKNNNAFQGK